MRLLNTKTGHFIDKDSGETVYAILSHTWRSREQTYDQLKLVQARYQDSSETGYVSLPSSPSTDSASETSGKENPIWDDRGLSRKIRDACKAARDAGYDYIWIDSCCIDKTSSTELSESINSMYLWYSRSKICYAHLADVPSGEDPRAADSAFRRSRWFSRGWTLQELIAPYSVIFVSKDWDVIGTKLTLVDVVEEVTGIPLEALSQTQPLDDFSVAQRFSWASKRQTTRAEDLAYSLLGIFDINMPPLYGEGERAFRRLQEEILRRVPDQSLFAWEEVFVDLDSKTNQDLAQSSSLRGNTVVGLDYRHADVLFAWEPERLMNGGAIKAVSHDEVFRRLQLPDLLAPQYTFTPHGIQTQLPVVLIDHCLPHSTITYPNYDTECQWYLAILGCEHNDHPGALLGRVCYISPSVSDVEYLYCEHAIINPKPSRGAYLVDIFPLSMAAIERIRKYIQLKTVYISHPGRIGIRTDDSWLNPHETIVLVLPKKTRDALLSLGYKEELSSPFGDDPITHRLVLSKADHTITIDIRHILEEKGQKLGIEAQVKMSQTLCGSSRDIVASPGSVLWEDAKPWSSFLDPKEFLFALPTHRLTVRLGFNWAEPSCYFIYADVEKRGPV